MVDLGSFPTRFDRFGRGAAIATLLALAVAILVAIAPTPDAPKPKVRASEAEQSDLQLYRDITARVAAGEAYYPVAADELRKGSYPLKPFVTFRAPTHATAYGLVGETVMVVLEGLLALAVLVVWWIRLIPVLPLRGRAAALILMVGGTATLIEPVTGLFHESWAALLMALMIGLRRPGHAAAAIIAGGLALMVRETVLPMILVMLGLATIERCWREAAGWAAVLGIFAVYLTWHAGMVATVVRPDDLASPGWQSFLGPRFALSAFSAVSSATVLPKALAFAAIILSIFGWASVRTGWAARVALMMLGYGAMLALFARPDTFYWALLIAPLSLAGLAFVPRAIAVLVRAARGMAQQPA
ncbi:hypothetical protein H9L12_06150 [Sphingomonas rhizophila]|uniref:DUF2029 domain-containing protein n=1 Tax=Sphingomonas rhizophila TaxID=2071607 RepID=A0A7G9SDY5_9SPHN|nr:hypothetical protein [Sphingomonas rhizophila]QNN66060.1 hypothetical protein H9L12_06150 [Sphingomonas rhizophila]